MIRHLLVAHDLTPEADVALARAAQLARQHDARASLPQQLLDELVAEELPVLPVYLMSSVKMRESHQACTPLIFLEPRHKLTQQFVELHGLLES